MKRITIIIIVVLLCATVGAKALDVNAPYGSRKNPAWMNYGIHTETSQYSIDIVVGDVARGDEAYDLIKKQSMFTSYPPAGYEYLVAAVYVGYVKDKTGTDKPFSINRHMFAISDSTYTIRATNEFIYIGEHALDATLYEGGSIIGWLAYQVKPDEDYYLVYQDSIWLELTPSQT